MVTLETMWGSEVRIPAFIKVRKAMFVMVLMTAESQVRKKDIGGFSGNLYPQFCKPRPTTLQKVTA